MNSVTNLSALFFVVRPCVDGRCPEGTYRCSCHGASGVEVDVDELSPAEVRAFQASGTTAQRSLIASYYGPDAAAEHVHLDAAA